MPQAQRVQPSYGGMNTNDAPDYLGPTEGALVENFLVDREGKLPMRGPIRQRMATDDGALVPASAASAGTHWAVWNFNNKLLIPYETAVAGVYKCRSEAGLPAGTFTDVAASDYWLDPQFTRLGNYVYGSYYDDAGGIHYLLRWDGTATFVPHTTNGPRSFYDIKAFQQRLLVLGGEMPGHTFAAGSTSGNSVFWSDIGGAATDLASYWKDDVSGLYNTLVIDAPGDTFVTGGRAGRAFIFLMNGSFHVLSGDGPSTWVVRPVTRDFGCSFRESVVEFDDGLFFASVDRGYIWTDGIDFRTVSGPVQTDFLADLAAADRVSTARLQNGYILIAPDGGSAPWLFHAPSGRWSRLSAHSTVANLTAIAAAGSAGGYPWVMMKPATDTSVWSLDELVMPEKAAESVRGLDTRAAVSAAIPAKWHSRLLSLASPSNTSSLRRLLFDYSFYRDADASAGDDGWYVTLVDGQGSTVMTEAQVPTQVDPPTQLARKRFQTQLAAEATDVQVRVEWSGSTDAVAKAEIYDATIVFEPGHQRKNA